MADNADKDLLVKTGEAVIEAAKEGAQTPMTMEQFEAMLKEREAQMKAEFEAKLDAERKDSADKIAKLEASNKVLSTARSGERKQFTTACNMTRPQVQALLAETGLEFIVTAIAKDGTRGDSVAWTAPLSAKNTAEKTPARYAKRFWVDVPSPNADTPKVLFMGDLVAQYRKE